MERESIAHHIKEDSGLEHLIASMQPRKYSKDYSEHSMKHWRIAEALEPLGNAFRSTRCLQDSTTKSSGACQTGAAGLLTGVKYSRVRDSAWMYLTSSINTQIGVELAVV